MNRTLLGLVLSLVLAWPGLGWGAVAFGTIGSGASGTNLTNASFPASIAAGDLLVMCISNKYPTNGPTTPTGWTAPANNQGTGDPGDGPGIGVGATYATILYRVADGTESGTVAVTVTSGNSTHIVIARYTNGTSSWSVAAANGGDSTSGTAWSATMGTDPGITGSDMVVACSARNANVAGASAEAISTAGVTYGAASERFDNAQGAGDDCGIIFSDHAVTSGTSSGAPVYTFTSGTNIAGGTAILRIRESATANNHLMLLGVGK